MLRKNKDWRTNILDLINIFNEYRNGNKTVIDKLFTSKNRFNRKGGYTGTDVFILNEGLDLLAYRIYEHYRKKAKFIPKKYGIAKYSEQPYFGTLNDVKMEIYIVLKELFDDMNFIPKDLGQIYKKVKNKLQRRLGKAIEKSVSALSENIVTADGGTISLFNIVESYGLLSCESPFAGNELDKDDFKHRREISEILNVLEKYDIKTLIQVNAHAQMNFVDFLKENYRLVYWAKEQSMRYPSEKELFTKYCQKYGDISQQRFSAMFRQLFNLLCDVTTTINNNFVSREMYLNDCYCSEKMNFVSLTSGKTNKLLKLGNKLTDYIPLKTYGDTFFNEITRSDVKEICLKNKALILAINNRENLSIEEYTDILCAVGFMLRDYCKAKVKYQLQRFMSDYNGYTFDINLDKLFDLCIGILPINTYWHIFKLNTGFSLRAFKKCEECEDGYFKPFTGRGSKVDFTDIKCIQIGLCRLFISDSNKAIYCRAVDKELPFVRRVENKNFGLLAS